MKSFRDRLRQRTDTEGRPKRACRDLRVESLEGRQLLAIAIFPPTPKFGPTPPSVTVNGHPATLAIPPIIKVNGQQLYEGSPNVVLDDSDRYVPLTVKGSFSQIVSSNLAGPSVIRPTPYMNAIKANLPNITPVDPTKPPLIVPVVATSNGGTPVLPPVVSNGRPVIYQVQPPAYELSIIESRLEGRSIPGAATLFVTDQYRQDEPKVYSPIQPIPTPDGKPLFNPVYATYFIGKGTDSAELQIATAYQLTRNYNYSFALNLQDKSNSGTGGRRYSVTIYDVDQDDGGAYVFQVLVPEHPMAHKSTGK